jgi:glycosyltransferase involved in cell wall biosynthesis
MAQGVAISVVVPLYNKRESILETLTSALDQSYSEYEIVVVDDGSTDGSDRVVESIDPSSIRLIRQQNRGASAARNTGVRSANGKYVAFLDADDRWEPNYLAELASLIADFPNCGIYGFAYKRGRGDGASQIRLHPAIARLRGLVSDYFEVATLGDQPFFTSSTCIKKSIFDEVGGFREGITHGEDLDLWARCALRYPVAYDARPLVTYRVEAENRAMGRPPPLGWIFEEEVANFRKAEPYRRLSSFIPEHVARIKLYHASLNMRYSDAACVRASLWHTRTRFFRLRRAALLLMTYAPSISERARSLLTRTKRALP